MFDPGDAEGVGHPEGNCRDVGVEVASRLGRPGMGDVEGCAAGAAFEGFDDKFGRAAMGDVVVQEAYEASATFGDPDGHDDVHHGLLR